jgi:hypothetical protein
MVVPIGRLSLELDGDGLEEWGCATLAAEVRCDVEDDTVNAGCQITTSKVSDTTIGIGRQCAEVVGA